MTELESLLSQALTSVTLARGNSSPVSQADYRVWLRRCRRAHDPVLSRSVSYYQPVVADSGAAEKLLHFVNAELAEHVSDGRLYSATIAFLGGLGSGSPVEDVMANLLRRAIVDGPLVASRAFYDCVNASSCCFYQFFLLSGIRIEEPVEVFRGITLIPVSESVSELPSHLPHLDVVPSNDHRFSVQHLLGKTLLRLEFEVSPVFHRPEGGYTLLSGPERHFSIRLNGGEVQDLNLGLFYEALSLASRRSVRGEMTWTSLLDYEIFDLSTGWGIGGSGWGGVEPFLSLQQPGLLGEPQLSAVKTLYRALSVLSSQTLDGLRVPIDRWMKSMEERDPIDQIIDLAIALESLYVQDSQTEVRFRLAINAAWHLGKSKSDRRDLLEFFQNFYRLRSNAVHTGRLPRKIDNSSSDVSEVVSRTRDLCWDGITAVINAGGVPEWRDLVLGEDLE